VIIALLLSLANHFMLMLMSIGMGRAIGIELPAIQYFMLVPVGLMIASIPLLPGGWGTREWGFRGIFAKAGVAATQSVALSVIIGLTQLVWSLLGGILFLMSPDRLSRKEVASFAEKMDAEAESASGESSGESSPEPSGEK
jgi:uncharacterized membrane protein YbhN (UPF0104 family)